MSTCDFKHLIETIHKRGNKYFWSLIDDPNYNIDEYIPTPGIIGSCYF